MKVMIAVDESEISEKVFDWYMESFHRSENEVFIIHEAEQPDLPTVAFGGGASFPAEEIGRIMAEHNRKRDELNHHYTMKCRRHHLNFKIKVDTAKDKPGHALVKRAEAIGANMILMGSRGLGLVRRSVLGSVSEYVLHHAKIPVLIYHN